MRLGRLLLLPLFALLVRPGAAESVLDEVRAKNWAEARAAAAAYADPVAEKLVAYYRLLLPDTATAAEIADFMAANPDWPSQGTLAKRRDEALAAEPDDAAAGVLCERIRPDAAVALLRCADAYARTGAETAAAAAARKAWLAGVEEPGLETRFLARWGGVLSEADQWQRFERLVPSDLAAAERQVARLAATDRPVAQARLALRQNAATAPALLAALTPAQLADPEMFLDHARWLRRNDQDPAAAALWKSEDAEAEGKAPPERRAAFWSERNLLAREMLRNGDAAGAYAVAAAHKQHAPEEVADAEFLAGFIALRFLHDPALAAPHFAKLAEGSKSVISNARAHYWLGRAAAARHDEAAAHAEYAAAATWPTTFYGQLAALALGDDPARLDARILALRDPTWDRQAVLNLIGRELARAALLLVAWGDPIRARVFLTRLEALDQDGVDRALAARLALNLALPETAVAIARRAGRDGLILPDAGWPTGANVPDAPVPPAVALGLIRQESSFDPGALSPSGARGLMQLMPATAETVARRIGVPFALASLTTDPAYNVQLGTAYLNEMLDQFGGALPLALAAYNAGPSRLRQWLAENGDPREGKIDAIDWIELISFGETRNYVQRVIENIVIYRARRHEILPHPLAQWLPPAA